MNILRLLRYNLRVVMSNNWWLLVFPLAVSQLTVFWTIITRKFSPAVPPIWAEMVTPLLAAFLCAHVMVPEYQSRVGAIIASKPLHIGKVVLLRIGALLALVWVLQLISLAAFYFGMAPYDLGPAFAASIPSTLFLSMLALTFATLFRNPLAGFAVAALYWCMDLPPGPPANAYLSLRSYSTYISSIGPQLDALVSPWQVAKILLLAGAVALYLIHARLVFRLGATPTMRARRRSIGWAAGILALYVFSGAGAKVVYGYSKRGQLQPNDGGWFRQQFMAYGPVPVAYAFGPAFRRYLGDTNGWRAGGEEADILGDTLKHHRELREVVEGMPGSIWAPSAAELLGRLTARQGNTADERVSVFQKVADRYPNSPYFEVALREQARIYDGSELPDSARARYEELLRLRPSTRYRIEALRYIALNERAHQNGPGMVKWAREWADAAPREEKAAALMVLAEGLVEQRDTAGARAAATRAEAAARAALKAHQSEDSSESPSTILKWQRENSATEERARALIKQLGG